AAVLPHLDLPAVLLDEGDGGGAVHADELGHVVAGGEHGAPGEDPGDGDRGEHQGGEHHPGPAAAHPPRDAAVVVPEGHERRLVGGVAGPGGRDGGRAGDDRGGPVGPVAGRAAGRRQQGRVAVGGGGD